MKDIPKFDVDLAGNCSKCGGIHYGTGRVCVFDQTFPEPQPKMIITPDLKTAPPIERYSLMSSMEGYTKVATGEWVAYSDHAAVVAALKAELESLRSEVAAVKGTNAD